MSFEGFLRLLHQSYDQPQAMARQVIAWRLTVQQSLWALGLAAICTTLLTLIPALLIPAGDPMMSAVLSRPLMLAGFQLLANVFVAFLIWRVGRLFGGQGQWHETLAVVAWLQIVMSALQAVQILVTLALPFLGLPVALFAIFSFFFLISQFTAALHGFASVGKVFGMVLVVMLLMGIGLAVLLALFVPVPPHV